MERDGHRGSDNRQWRIPFNISSGLWPTVGALIPYVLDRSSSGLPLGNSWWSEFRVERSRWDYDQIRFSEFYPLILDRVSPSKEIFLKKIYIIKSTPWLKDLSFKIKPIFFKKEIQKEFMKNIVLFYIFKKNHKIYTSNSTVIETLSEYLNERGKSCNASPSGTDREAFTPKFSAPIPAEALRQCNIIRSSVSKGYRFTKRHPILLLPRN